MLFLAGLILASTLSAQSALDKLVGKWKYVSEKAVPPDENIAAETITIEKLRPNTYRETVDQVMKSGQKQTRTTTQTCDGTEHHIDGTPQGMTMICQPQTHDFVTKRDGNIVMEVKTEFSDDGRIVTFHRKRLSPNGQWLEDTRVWEKEERPGQK